MTYLNAQYRIAMGNSLIHVSCMSDDSQTKDRGFVEVLKSRSCSVEVGENPQLFEMVIQL